MTAREILDLSSKLDRRRHRRYGNEDYRSRKKQHTFMWFLRDIYDISEEDYRKELFKQFQMNSLWGLKK